MILLAAGKSTRMGAHKLVLPINGRPLVTYALATAARSGAAEVILVVGHNAQDVLHALPEGSWRVVECADYAEGMSASLRAGVQAVAEGASGAVILLADQPLITAGLLRVIVSRAASTPERIVATRSNGRPTTPVYFPRSLFGELMTVTGDEGGRSVIARHRELVDMVEPQDERELLDVDDAESLQRARTLLERPDGSP